MITEIIQVAQTALLFFGLQSLNHMRKQNAIQAYTALSDRLFQQNVLELNNVRLFASLDYSDGENPDEDEVLKRQVKHYLFMQFTMYEQMFCLHESCKYTRHAMDPWHNRIFSLVKKKRMCEYWRQDYSKQACDGFKEFIDFCLQAESHHELNEFFKRRKSTSIAKYCPVSSVCNS